MWPILIALTTPFIQLGFSYWLSIASVLAVAVLIFIKFRPVKNYLTIRSNKIYDIIAILICLGCFLDIHSADINSDVLYIVRNFAFFFLLSSTIAWAESPGILRLVVPKYFPHVITSVIIFMFVFSVVQMYRMRSGYFGISPSLYVQNSNTILSYNDILWSKTIRPTATFGEPSYLAFYCVSLLIISYNFLKIREYRPLGVIATLSLVSLGVLSQSGAFIISAFTLFGAVALRYISRRILNKSSGGGALVIVLTAGLVAAGFYVFTNANFEDSRIIRAASGADLSVNIRVLGPLNVLPYFIIDHPFGVPISRLPDELATYATRLGYGALPMMDNAVFLNIFSFGFAGIVLLFRLCTSTKKYQILLYLLLCLNFNGSIFSPDKFAIIAFSVVLFAYYNSMAKGVIDFRST